MRGVEEEQKEELATKKSDPVQEKGHIQND